MTNVNLPADAVIRYLNIALKTKERTAPRFIQDYGPSSSAVAEINREIAKLKLAINTIQSGTDQTDLPLEKPKTK